MALGVLNNLSAIYAENNLNNTNNSLQTVLEQLSSGSKINSGADDAAGLSLVNGLEANSSALTQSETNAAEGVGLLDVADGALSQVTNLLNRAITLATEASNGTLNSTQESAANQEYQSILAEVNNIGQTTTYNQQQVFNGDEVAIYTGDSSTAGSSIDDLNIRTLSESTVGDTGGVMAYSSGSDNVFINLSTGAANAQATDSLNGGLSGSTTINVSYLVKGAGGTESAATTSISVGAGTSYANTADGLISAINSAGLGLSASFATQAEAGVEGGGSETGIQISGGLVSVGVDPSSASTSGVLNLSGISASELLTQGQSITLQTGADAAVTIDVTSGIDSLSTLAGAIDSQDADVSATVMTNGNGTQSLSLADKNSGAGALSVSIATASSAPISMTFVSGGTGATGNFATGTLGFGSAVSSTGNEVVGGTVVLSNSGTPGANPVTFVMGSGAAMGSSAGSFSGSAFDVNGNTLGSLATAIAAELGVSATVSSSGITMTSIDSGTTIEAGLDALTATPGLSQTGNVSGATATNGTNGSTTITMNGGNGFAGSNEMTGSIVLTNGNGATPYTFTMGTAAGVALDTYTTGAITATGLWTEINQSTSTTNISASLVAGQLVLTSTQPGTSIAMTGSTLVQTTDGVAATVTASTPSIAVPSPGATFAIGGTGATTGASDTLTGDIVLNPYSGGVGGTSAPVTFTMGAPVQTGIGSGNVAVFGNTLAALMSAINADEGSTGISATYSTAADAGLNLTTTQAGGLISVNSTGLTDNSPIATAHTATTGTIGLASGGNYPSAGAALTGSVVITDGTGTDTFVMGGGYGVVNNGANNNTVHTALTTLASLQSAIELQSGVTLSGLTAIIDGTGGISITGATGLTTINATGLIDNIAPTAVNGHSGAVGAYPATAATVSYSNASLQATPADATTDVLTGSILLSNTAGGGGTYTFVMGTGNNTGSTYYTGTGQNTLADLQTTINNVDGAGALDVSTNIAGGVLKVTSGSTTSTLTQGIDTLVDTADGMFENSTVSTPSPAVVSANATISMGVGSIDHNPVVGTGDTLTGSIVITNGIAGNYTFGMTGSGIPAGADDYAVTGNSLSALMAEMDLVDATTGVTAAMNSAGTGLNFTTATTGTSIAINSSDLSDASKFSFTSPASGTSDTSQKLSGVIALTDGGDLTGSGVLSGSVVVTNGNGTVTDTFVMGAGANSSTYGAGGGTFELTSTSLSGLMSAINTEGSDTSNSGVANLDLTASQDGATGGIFLQSSSSGATGLSANAAGLTDTLAEASLNGSNGVAGLTHTAAMVNFANGSIGGLGVSPTTTNSGADQIAGSIVLENVKSGGVTTYGLGGGAVTFTVGGSASDDTDSQIYTGSDTSLQGMANAIDAASTALGLNLSAQAGATGLTVTSTDPTSVLTNATNSLVDVYGAEQGRQVPGTTGGSATYATATVGTSGQIGPGDVLSGSIVLNNTSGIQQTFTIGSTYLVNGASVTTGGDTLQDLATAIGEDAALGVNASAANGFLNLQSSSLNTSITVGNGNPAGITLVDRLTATASAPSTGAPGGTSTATVQLAGGQTTAASGDTITGSISLTGATGTKAFVMGGSSSTGTIAVGSTAGGETLGALADAITNSGIGIIATVPSAGLSLMGATENGTAITKGFDTLQDSTATAALAYTPVSGYDLGISNSTLAGRSSVYDSSTGQSATGTNANFSFNSVAGNGVATMSYSDGAGQSLSATDLSNQTDAETALNDLNTAIMDVAAQDGYIGAQINTLNSVSQVMTTQQENVVSAQNAIQATDYASATSNMSKYEILSQTGIAALAQANSVQQEVTKLLQ